MDTVLKQKLGICSGLSLKDMGPIGFRECVCVGKGWGGVGK